MQIYRPKKFKNNKFLWGISFFLSFFFWRKKKNLLRAIATLEITILVIIWAQNVYVGNTKIVFFCTIYNSQEEWIIQQNSSLRVIIGAKLIKQIFHQRIEKNLISTFGARIKSKFSWIQVDNFGKWTRRGQMQKLLKNCW